MSFMAIYWIILFLVLLLIELATVNLVSIWFAVGALGAFATSFFTNSILIQLLIFVVISVISLLITLPIVKKFKSKESIVPTNLDRVIGRQAEVTKEIKPNHYGEVEIFGTETPLKRAGQPFELAPAYLYLASDLSRYVTGQIIHVNGGTIV